VAADSEKDLLACTPLGPYSRTMPRLLRRSWGGTLLLMSEVSSLLLSSQGTPVGPMRRPTSDALTLSQTGGARAVGRW